MAEKWTRPASAPFPAVYTRFTGSSPKNGGPLLRFRVQDAPVEMTDQLVDFMSEDFASDEPMCKGLKIKAHKESMDDLRNLWYHAIRARLALVCLQEMEDGSVRTEDGTSQGKPVIVGANITTLATAVPEKSDEKHTDIMTKFLRCFNMLTDKSQVFEKNGVNEIMTAYGLSVAKEFRGQNIGSELLRARVPLCKAVGLKVTGTVFTAKASQILARRCGFVLLAAIPYREFKEVHDVDFGDTGCENMEYMALEIN